jgi:hypothetical protein
METQSKTPQVTATPMSPRKPSDVSTGSELWSPSFKLNPTTHSFYPDASSTVIQDSTTVQQPPTGDIQDPTTVSTGDTQGLYPCGFDYATSMDYVPQDFNFDFSIDPEYMVGTACNIFAPMCVQTSEPIAYQPTLESLELSLQILWAEHRMKTQDFEQYVFTRSTKA